MLIWILVPTDEEQIPWRVICFFVGLRRLYCYKRTWACQRQTHSFSSSTSGSWHSGKAHHKFLTRVQKTCFSWHPTCFLLPPLIIKCTCFFVLHIKCILLKISPVGGFWSFLCPFNPLTPFKCGLLQAGTVPVQLDRGSDTPALVWHTVCQNMFVDWVNQHRDAMLFRLFLFLFCMRFLPLRGSCFGKHRAWSSTR